MELLWRCKGCNATALLNIPSCNDSVSTFLEFAPSPLSLDCAVCTPTEVDRHTDTVRYVDTCSSLMTFNQRFHHKSSFRLARTAFLFLFYIRFFSSLFMANFEWRELFRIKLLFRYLLSDQLGLSHFFASSKSFLDTVSIIQPHTGSREIIPFDFNSLDMLHDTLDRCRIPRWLR